MPSSRETQHVAHVECGAMFLFMSRRCWRCGDKSLINQTYEYVMSSFLSGIYIHCRIHRIRKLAEMAAFARALSLSHEEVRSATPPGTVILSGTQVPRTGLNGRMKLRMN
jgi:hypothetical protein